MRRTPLTGALAAAAVSGLLIAGAGSPAGAAENPRPEPQKASKSEAKRDAKDSIAKHPRAVRAADHDTFKARAVKVDDNGTRHVHFDREYKGMPVLGGDVIVHSAADGALRETTLSLKKPLTLGKNAEVGAKAAEKAAEKLFEGKRDNVTSQLVVDAATGEKPRLAWQVEVNGIAPDQSPSHLNVLVDAKTGKTGQTWNDFHKADGSGDGYHVGDVTVSTTPVSGGYRLMDPARGNGETRDANNSTTSGIISDDFGSAFTSSDSSWGDGTLSHRETVAVDAHYGIQETWDYFEDVHDRSGIRGDGVGAQSYVHWGDNYSNAGWDDNSFAMIYGDGAPGSLPFTQLDVAGHEMSHGVTSATANLNYYGDAGGLNEATSDIFGTLVEFHSNTAADQPDYLIGEKIDIRGDGTPLRWMDQPSTDGRSVDCWSSSTDQLDPHYSSGVGNHFFYLLAVGSGSSQWGDSPTCDSSTVTGIGNTDAGRIWYRALTTYMTSGTTYPGARTATVQAATDLFGADSTQCRTVEQAWSAVNVAPTSATCGTGDPDPGTDGIVNGDFEDGSAGWNATSGVITDSTSGISHSGSWYAWLCGYGSTHADNLSQSVTVPAGGGLSFHLAISTDETSVYDFDTLRVQVVSGSGTETLATYGNSDFSGYTLRTFDLSGYAGESVTVKFVAEEDSSYGTSFLIDDVSVAG